MTAEEQKALLEKVKKEANEAIDSFKSSLKDNEAIKNIEKQIETINDSISKINLDAATEPIKKEAAELRKALETQGEALTLLKTQTVEEPNQSVAKAIVDVFKKLGVNSFATMKAVADKLKDGVEIVGKFATTDYTGTVSRTQSVSPVRFATLRPLAFVPNVRQGSIENGKSIIMWTPASYTANTGYAGENSNTVSENSGAATEKTRKTAKISAKQYLSAETFEDLPQFAQRLQMQLEDNAMLFLDTEIWSGIGADGGAHTEKIYGLKTQGVTAFDAASAIAIEKATILDLVDSCGTQAEVNFHKADTIWMSPRLANKLRRTKATDGQYIINLLVTGEEVMGGYTVIRTTLFGDNEILVGSKAAIQLWVKRNLTMKVGQFSQTDVESDRFTAILFMRAQCLVEDDDKKALIYVSDVTSAVAAITAGA